MGALKDFFFKNHEFNKELIKAVSLHYVLINGLYKNVDGSTPELEEFEAKGFSEDQYLKLVHGTSRDELQAKVMLPHLANRNLKASVMKRRLSFIIASKNKNPKRNKSKHLDESSFPFENVGGFSTFGLAGSNGRLSYLELVALANGGIIGNGLIDQDSTSSTGFNQQNFDSDFGSGGFDSDFGSSGFDSDSMGGF